MKSLNLKLPLLGVIFGNRDFFPDQLVSEARADMANIAKGKTMPGAGILDISTYSKKVIQRKTISEITPPQVAEVLETAADTALNLLSEMAAAKEKELRFTLGDLTAMAHLGNYYAENSWRDRPGHV
jgi:hypothetical protein